MKPFDRPSALFAGAGALFALPFLLASLEGPGRWVGVPDADIRATMGPIQRALGPLSSVAASVEWVRFRQALEAGDPARAYRIAEHALELDSRSERGWLELSQHLIFVRGSFLENETLAERRRWIQQGLDVLRRGEALTSDPAELAFFAGLVRCSYLAGIPDEDLAWPGGPEALMEEGRRDLERAAAGGRKDVAETLRALEDSLEEGPEETQGDTRPQGEGPGAAKR